jgi:hypothetical protein
LKLKTYEKKVQPLLKALPFAEGMKPLLRTNRLWLWDCLSFPLHGFLSVAPCGFPPVVRGGFSSVTEFWNPDAVGITYL